MRTSAAREDHRARAVRTCVGCGLKDDAAALLRLIVADGEVAFVSLFSNGEPHRHHRNGGDVSAALGRGAHVHPRSHCLSLAPKGLARAFHCEVITSAAQLGKQLVAACDRRMIGLLLAARRTRMVAVGGDASCAAIREGAPLVVVALDAGSIGTSLEVSGAVAEGRAIGWKTKNELGALLGVKAVALCAVRHAGIAEQLKVLRAAADAGAAMTGEGAECSRCPEAR
ncbi:MAG: YlxR family protein [Myxococcota bacterium]|nr:YlxR family protein [Myxococcota bacterium]